MVHNIWYILKKIMDDYVEKQNKKMVPPTIWRL